MLFEVDLWVVNLTHVDSDVHLINALDSMGSSLKGNTLADQLWDGTNDSSG